jgi:hypothetical protein
LFAQADRGSISGTITDSTGAAVPSVALTLKNQATNLTYSTTASASGAYSFLNLPIGMYTLTAAAKGFARSGGQRHSSSSQPTVSYRHCAADRRLTQTVNGGRKLETDLFEGLR